MIKQLFLTVTLISSLWGEVSAQSYIKDPSGVVMYTIDSLGEVSEFGGTHVLHIQNNEIHDINQDELAHISGDTLYDPNNDVLGRYSSGVFYDVNNDVLAVFSSGNIEDQDGVLIATYMGFGKLETSYLLFFHLMF